MSIKRYLLFCEYCSYRRITDGSDIQDLYEYKTTPMMTGVPKYDLLKKETVVPKSKNQRRRWRCPKCGKGSLFPKKIAPKVYEDEQEKPKNNDLAGRKDRNEGPEIQG